MSSALLEVKGLSRSFGKVQAVQELSFGMEKGQVHGFIGPNGAGKTTTMRIVATLDLPDAGDALVDGTSVLVEPRKVRMRVGFMSDQFHPYPNLDVMQYLDFFARAYGLRGWRRVRTVRSVASFCGLGDFADRPATALSKGMGQRLHLAKTLLHDPTLLILDEPAAGLDPRARIEFRELVKELQPDRHRAVDPDHAARARDARAVAVEQLQLVGINLARDGRASVVRLAVPGHGLGWRTRAAHRAEQLAFAVEDAQGPLRERVRIGHVEGEHGGVEKLAALEPQRFPQLQGAHADRSGRARAAVTADGDRARVDIAGKCR